jgi:hypothetical protein
MTIKWEATTGKHLYTRNQADGALLNGTRIQKVHSEPGDGHQDGAAGTVIGSIGPQDMPDRYAYFIVWDEEPGAGLPVGITEGRVKVHENHHRG